MNGTLENGTDRSKNTSTTSVNREDDVKAVRHLVSRYAVSGSYRFRIFH
jgi:hypothetical protein